MTPCRGCQGNRCRACVNPMKSQGANDFLWLLTITLTTWCVAIGVIYAIIVWWL